MKPRRQLGARRHGARGASNQQQLLRVGECLYRSDKTKIYYPLFKRGGRRIKRSSKTTKRRIAEKKLEELRPQVGQITIQSKETMFADQHGEGILPDRESSGMGK